MSEALPVARTRARALADLLPGTGIVAAAREVALVAGGIVLLALSARVAVPLPFTPVPVTGQTFAVLLIGAGYGLRRGLITMVSYLVVGLAGGAVFSPDPKTGNPRTGEQLLHSPSAGYIVGMLLAVGILGWLSGRSWDRRLHSSVPQMVIANLAVYAVGLPWLAFSAHLSLQQTLVKGLVPFVVGDLLKLTLAAGTLPLVWRLVKRAPRD